MVDYNRSPGACPRSRTNMLLWANTNDPLPLPASFSAYARRYANGRWMALPKGWSRGWGERLSGDAGKNTSPLFFRPRPWASCRDFLWSWDEGRMRQKGAGDGWKLPAFLRCAKPATPIWCKPLIRVSAGELESPPGAGKGKKEGGHKGFVPGKAGSDRLEGASDCSSTPRLSSQPRQPRLAAGAIDRG